MGPAKKEADRLGGGVVPAWLRAHEACKYPTRRL
jgi:hypothetical protein